FDLGLDSDTARDRRGGDGSGDFDLSELDRELAKRPKASESAESGTDGYYIANVKGQLAAILVRTPLGSFDVRSGRLRTAGERCIAEVDPKRIDPNMRIGFTGDLITGAEAENAVVRDLVHVGTWGVCLVLGVVLLYFQRLRVLFGMGLTILVGCVWAFAAAKL